VRVGVEPLGGALESEADGRDAALVGRPTVVCGLSVSGIDLNPNIRSLMPARISA
jgi:hypothetical protein